MNYTTGNLPAKKVLCHFPLAIALNRKKIIIFSRYKTTARRLQSHDCL